MFTKNKKLALNNTTMITNINMTLNYFYQSTLATNHDHAKGSQKVVKWSRSVAI